MEELDVQAWEQFKAYRTGIRKPIKPVSEQAMKLKLQRFGKDQAAVVQQSVENQWQGLFPLKQPSAKPSFGDKPIKSEKQVAADQAWFENAKAYSAKGWEQLEPSPFNRLKLCDALWARYTVDPGPNTPEYMAWLKDVIGLHLRMADASAVLGDPSLRTMVWCFFGKTGIDRLKAKAAIG